MGMNRRVYLLPNCSTCQRVVSETGLEEKGFQIQDIRSEKITAEQLDEMKRLSGSYESLFSRRAMKYQSMGLKDKFLAEQDYRSLILEEYTFLKRPVVVTDGRIFVGSDKANVQALKKTVEGL